MDNIVGPKADKFANRISKLHTYLVTVKKEFVCSKQVARSGTAIGALIKESVDAQSRPDFLNKMNIALKEARETAYWLQLLRNNTVLSDVEFNSIYKDCDELIRLLVSIVKTTKKSLNR
jgi:four helix bundle protein